MATFTPTPTLRCGTCKQDKHPDAFHRHKGRPSGRHNRCRTCASEGRAGKGKSNYVRNTHLVKTYGITAEQYDEMALFQGGVCAICSRPETAIGNGGVVKRLAVDHDHETGVVRALLCTKCNVALGAADDSVDRLLAMASYLKEHDLGHV